MSESTHTPQPRPDATLGKQDSNAQVATMPEHSTGREDDGGIDFLSPSSDSSSLGRLDHYEILEVVGRGGMGIVFKAFDTKLRRTVALKTMVPRLAALREPRLRFIREAQAAAAVSHDHVVAIHAVQDEGPIPYIVMQLINGISLRDRLSDYQPLPLEEIVRIGCQAARGLAAAHAQGLVHRDIKPANILLDNLTKRVKITDFGLARAADDSDLTHSGIPIGTPQFMSPEQADAQSVDHRSDLFSLGSVLYAMCTGQPPFRGDSRLAVLRRVCDETPPPVSEVNPRIPAWLSDAVARLHAKAPHERFSSAGEVVELFERHLAAMHQGASNPLHAYHPAAGVIRDEHPGSAMNRAERSTRTRKAARTLLVLALFTGALAGVAWFGEWFGPGDAAGPAVDELPPAEDLKPQAVAAVAPFDAQRARELQEAWAEKLGLDAEFTNAIGMRLRLIPPGEFTMGSARKEIEEALANVEKWNTANVVTEWPARRVRITQPFYIGVHEVTVGQFRTFVTEMNYKTTGERTGQGGRIWSPAKRVAVMNPDMIWKHPLVTASEQHPVVFISLEDARAFCEWLSRKDGRTYTIPAETQWEYACRAGTTTHWYWGNEEKDSPDHGWFLWNATAVARAVGMKRPNAFGLYDMAGNVAEMTIDEHGKIVMRGGSAGYPPWQTRSAAREHPNHNDPMHRNGLRVICEVPVRDR